MPPVEIKNDLFLVLNFLPEKFVVDFANGIDVARDHIRIQKKNDKFFTRMFDGLSGKSARRQNEINQSLADGVEGALNWLTELTNSVAKTNYALTKVNERLGIIQENFITLVNYSADTRQQLEELSTHVHSRMDEFSYELNRVDITQRATIQLDHVFDKWAAGKLNQFSPITKCYITLEELRWGDFGELCRNQIENDQKLVQTMLEILANRLIQQLTKETDTTAQQRVGLVTWTNPNTSEKISTDWVEALNYAGDWAQPDPHPFVFTTTQMPNQLPVFLPRICSAERVAEAMVSEIFERN